jgi:triphosphatase
MLTLGFVLDPADASRLMRHPALAVRRGGPGQPARRRMVRLAWHDTPHADLAGKGLALVHAGRDWRLERVHPGAEHWPPGLPPPVLGEARSAEQLGAVLPPGLAVRARFVGRETYLVLGDGDAALDVRLLRGALHVAPEGGDAAERPCCRLTLAGPEAAVVALAKTLAGSFSIALPAASLAAEAIAASLGTIPPPRRIGTIALRGGMSVGEAFPAIVAHLTDVMLFWSRAIGAPGHDPEPVHQMRAALRRPRSAISVFRGACASPTVLGMGERLRDLGQVLGPARDWDVFLAGLGARVADEFSDEPAVTRLLREGERRRAQAYAQLSEHLGGAAFRRLCIALAAISAGTGWQDGLDGKSRAALAQPVEVFAAEVLSRRHRRVKRRGDHFEKLDVPALHAVRLAAKRLRYAAEFSASIFAPKPAARFIRRLAMVQDRLGHLNDSAVAAALLAQLGPPTGARGLAVGLVRGFAAAEATHGRRGLLEGWKRFRALKPFWRLRADLRDAGAEIAMPPAED